MNKYTHFVKLTPLGRFCFGGESYANKGEKVFYLQRSRDFPQQTSVLGLVRYQLLKQAQLLNYHQGRERLTNAAMQKQEKHNKGMAQLLIGTYGFDPENCPANFGVIDRLSPVFITDAKNRHLIPVPKVKAWDDDKTKKEMLYHLPELSVPSKGKGYLMNNTETSASHPLNTLKNYNPKYGFEVGFKDCEGDEYVRRKDVFDDELEPHIGIFKSHTLKHRRDEKDNPEQEGFFKIEYKRLQEGYAFGFYISLNEKVKFESQSMVVFGKERSPFRMEVLDANQPTPFDEPVPNVQKGQYLWLASNAKVDPEEIYTCCDTLYSEEESFRCMVSRVDQNWNYYGKPQKREGAVKPTDRLLLSGRYNLLKRGSLLKIKDSLSEAQLKSFSNTAFQLIGYNHFLIFNSQQ